MSDHKQAAAQRRDERNVKTDERQHAQPAKKDKKKWCRGKVGVEHAPKCMPYAYRGGFAVDWREFVCVNCGKRLEYYYPLFFKGAINKPAPAWVTENNENKT